MNRVFKTFLLWLLIAAMPIQGVASVIKASCGPNHHAISPAVMSVATDHHHADGQGAHDHGYHGASMAQPDVQKVDSGSDQVSDVQPFHKTSYCSACAACCFGATAPPASVSLTPVFSTIHTVVLPPVVSFTGFIPAGLERPPRLLSV